MNRQSAYAFAFLLATALLPLRVDAAEFRVFDATYYAGKPDLTAYGIERLRIVGSANEWWSGLPRLSLPPRKLFEERLREIILREKPRKGDFLCIDIEYWPDLEAAKTPVIANNYLEVLRWAREYAPDYLYGYYGVMPPTVYYEALASPEAPDRVRWAGANNALAKVAAEVDAVFPSLYTFTGDADEWKRAAIVNLSEARRHGKPVYAFLWPQYHNSVEFWRARKFFDAKLWAVQLETVAAHADGVVIWGGWDFDNNKPLAWDESAPWWIATRDFINRRLVTEPAPIRK